MSKKSHPAILVHCKRRPGLQTLLLNADDPQSQTPLPLFQPASEKKLAKEDMPGPTISLGGINRMPF
jgi:hypothetical protein